MSAQNSLTLPESVIREAEERLKRGAPAREAVKANIRNRRFSQLDTAKRRKARTARVLGDPIAAAAATKQHESMAPEQSIEDFIQERLIGGDNFLGIRFFDLGRRASRSIARVDIRTPDGRSGCGTGSLVSRRLLLTNHHVLRDESWAAGSFAVFDFEDDIEGRPRETITFALEPDTFFIADQALDFALVAVSAESIRPGGTTLASYGFNPLDPQQGKVNIGELINIIQHPSGMTKQVVVHDNRLLELPENPAHYLHYECDTMPGSSGAPLFNNRWEVVGLHHAGWPRRDDDGRILTRDGGVWSPSMGEQAIHWLGNEGIRVSAIIERLNERRTSLRAEGQRLLDEILTPPPRTGSVVTPVEPVRETDAVVPVRPQSPAAVTASAGSVSFSVPLRITVSLGDQQIARVEPAPQQPPPIAPPPEAPREDSKAAAMRELEEAAKKPYYDKQTDHAERDAYYEDIDFNADRAALYTTLSELLTRTHVRKLGYKPQRELYPWVDLYPNRKLVSLYTGEVYSPEKIIEEAFAAEAVFEAMRQELLLRESAGDLGAREDLALLLEAGPAYNCEHVVPQSWFKGADSATPKGDLHHLFTCQMKCNSLRSSVPFWEFKTDKPREGCGTLETNRFEPLKGKGPAARATLYFLLRYPGRIDNNVRELQAERLDILLAWHAKHPIDDYERHRNAAIYRKQGNRNPLIDFPELATKIEFKRGLGKLS